MQINKKFSYIVVLLLQFLICFQVVAQNSFSPKIKSATDNFINKNNRYKIFETYIKIHKILEKLSQNELSKYKYIQLKEVENIIKDKILQDIDNNSKALIRTKLFEILTNKWIIKNNINIIEIKRIEDKTYTAVNRIFNKFKVTYVNSWATESVNLNVFYNWDIWIYYRPQEDIVVNDFKQVNLEYIVNNKKISWTLSYNSNITNQKLIILTTWAGNNDRDFFVSRHRINYVLSKYLNNEGYATFVYDKSSVEASTWENFLNLTTDDLAFDLSWIIDNLKKEKMYNFKNIWLLWHSEWWIMSSIVASKRSDISFLILLSAPYDSFEQLIQDGSINYWIWNISQEIRKRIDNHLIALAEISKTNNTKQELDNSINNYIASLNLEDKIIFNLIKNSFSFWSIDNLSSKWFKKYLTLNINDYLAKIYKPVLIINWDKDFLIDDSKMADINKLIVSKNPKSRLEIIKDAWHMLENNTSWKNEDYSDSYDTINSSCLEKITSWLKLL